MALRNRNNHYNQLNTNDTDPRSNMAPEKYQPLNGTDDFGEGSNSRPLPTSDIRVLHQRLEQDPRFSPPPPSIWKRLALIFILFFLLWLGYRLQSQHNISQTQPPKIVHANRYSKEHKFRPAASPIITERMKDGKTRLRGAVPTFR